MLPDSDYLAKYPYLRVKFYTMKCKVALLAGGYSGESVISYQSAQQVAAFIPPGKYDVFVIDVKKDSWICHLPTGDVHVNRDDFSMTTPEGKVVFDIAFDMIHGTPGENGMLQSYLEMLRIPHTTCKSAVAALTFNKFYCNSVVRELNLVNVSRSIHLTRANQQEKMPDLAAMHYPLFVKPASGGSSIGMSKIYQPGELTASLQKAFAEDDEILVEEFISGRELTCGIFFYQGTFIPLSVTEIVSKKDFFDYEAKYQQGFADEITPAPIDASLFELIRSTSEKLYSALDCFGVCRFDYIYTGTDLYFLEVNTIPGMSAASIIPAQARTAGYSLPEFTDMLLTNGLQRKF